MSNPEEALFDSWQQGRKQGMSAGIRYERERIIKLLHEKAAVNWIEALEYPYFADELESLIRGEQ